KTSSSEARRTRRDTLHVRSTRAFWGDQHARPGTRRLQPLARTLGGLALDEGTEYHPALDVRRLPRGCGLLVDAQRVVGGGEDAELDEIAGAGGRHGGTGKQDTIELCGGNRKRSACRRRWRSRAGGWGRGWGRACSPLPGP